MPDLRYRLLNEPRLEVLSVTEEARSRTEMMRAQLCRERERAATGNEISFLRNLNIKLKITRLRGDEHLGRAAELIQRTTQFNINQDRYDIETLRSLLQCPEAEIYVLEAEDRFTAYGVVGVCILREGAVASLVMSCRVLTLRPAVPFLVSALRFGSFAEVEVWGQIVETDRNGPCRNVFLDAGFTKQENGMFVRRPGQLVCFDPAIYDVAVADEGPSPEAVVKAASWVPPTTPGSPVEGVTINPSKNGAATFEFRAADEDGYFGIRFRNATIADCIRLTYRVEPYQLSAPEELYSQRYDILIAMRGSDAAERAWAAMREALAARFHMEVRRETRTIPVYEMTVGKRGLKIDESKVPGQSSRIETQKNGLQQHEFRATNLDMRQFAGFLSASMDRPVLDRTGVSGVFDFELRYDLRQPIFKSIRKMLGLSLEPCDRPIEIVVAEPARAAGAV
jgi:uncharacterized protein (TIGR03435 family)